MPLFLPPPDPASCLPTQSATQKSVSVTRVACFLLLLPPPAAASSCLTPPPVSLLLLPYSSSCYLTRISYEGGRQLLTFNEMDMPAETEPTPPAAAPAPPPPRSTHFEPTQVSISVTLSTRFGEAKNPAEIAHTCISQCNISQSTSIYSP